VTNTLAHYGADANIRLGLKIPLMTNTLAYYCVVTNVTLGLKRL
jgi:hypothetical protein